MAKSMIIVGGGIAGLATGCYAQMNGYKTTIFEMHKVPGGLCAAWNRKGYTFDISMHMLTNSKRGPFHKMWQELGVIQGREFHYHDRMTRIEGKNKTLDFWVDEAKLREQLLALSPADAALSNEFVDLFCGRDIMGIANINAPEVTGFFARLRMFFKIIPMLGHFRKYGKTSLQEFAQRFTDPFLASAVRFIIDSPGWPMPQFPMGGMAGFSRTGVSEAGCPIGGSWKVVCGIADRYKRLGGDIRFKCCVKDVIIEKDKVIGIQLEDGSIHKADLIVWAADGHHLIYDILKGRYIDEKIKKMYAEWLPVQPLVHVMLGVNRDLSREANRIIMELDKPITVAGKEFKWLFILNHCFDQTTAPAGKSALEVWYATDFGYWQDLAKDRTKYEAEKNHIAEVTVEALEKRWPGIRSQIEVTDVPTPMTYVRYTGNWRGSPDGWYVTVDNMMDRSMLRSLPGLEGLYTVGQWTAPYTGTIMAALSGRQLIQILCKKNKHRFVTTIRN